MSRYQVSDELWKQSLSDYDELKGIQWDCQALDGAITKAPLSEEKNRTQSDRSRQARR